MKRFDLHIEYSDLKKTIKIPYPFSKEHLNTLSTMANGIRNPVFHVDSRIRLEVFDEMRKLPVRKVEYRIV